MRSHRPQPGPTDPIKTPAQPGGGAARPDIEGGQAATGSTSPQSLKTQSALTELARLLGRQFARDASSKGGCDD